MENNDENNKELVYKKVEYEQEVTLAYEGPIPHPDIFKGLKEVDPTFPERVMKMAELNGNAIIDREKQKSQRKLKKIKLEERGQAFIFILALVLIGLSVYLVQKGNKVFGIISLFAGISHVIIAAINNLRRK